MIVNHINMSNALLSETTYNLGNLIDTSDNTKLDTTTVTKILDILGDYNGSTIRTAANLKSLNANKPIVFQMGEINGNKIYWEAVYQTGAVLTIWMTNPYTAEWFNDKNYTMKNPDLAGYDKGKYSNLGNYSQSGLRDVTKGIYTEQSQLFPAISSIVVSPSKALPDPNNEADKGIDWQREQENGYYWYTAENYWSITNGLESNDLGTSGGSSDDTDRNPHKWTWDSTAYNDKFWIPSYYEVFNDGNGENIGSNSVLNFFNGGKWALTADDIKFSQTSNGLNGVSGVSSSCWLRSGLSSDYSYAMRVYSSGSAHDYGVRNSLGVRPAAHLSLESLANTVGYNISASVASGATDRAQINGSNSAWSGKYTNGQGDLNITYTSNSNYYINSITLNGTSVTINESAPASYSTLGSSVCQYKVWRNNANTVTVTLNNCTAAINVVGNVGNTLNLSNTGGANVTSLNYSRATYDTTTATITGAVASGYTPQLRYGASEYATLYNTSGSGTLGGINYSYSKTGTTDFTITITGISTGITNIPTVYINAINQVQITFNTTGGDGTVSLSTGNYTIGSTITVYAAPATNCAFLYWIDSTDPSNIITTNPLVVQVSTARTYTAIFSNSLLDGVAVGATVGGEARIVGFDENTITDNDEVTLIAVCYTGYTFSGWYVNGELLSGYGTSARVKYSEIKDKMVVAMFAPINNNSTNGETDNDQTSDIV